ncbi:MAG TPA: DUF881 domain-containing protein, partial [Actinotalea sp.]|nr:DUF881 domain-containing protein [Actinotalea sp.]
RGPQDLPGLVQAQLDRAEVAQRDVARLRAEVDALTDELTSPATADPSAAPNAAALAAGWTALAGPGVEVKLWDASPGAARPESVTSADLVVHQQDVQAVINALWAGGAEAMMLQDQRVVTTSAFRCVGNVLYLQGRVYSPPYVIRAIGEAETMLAALYDDPSVQTYLQYVEALGLGWSVSKQPEVQVPAYDGPAELRWAVVAQDQGSVR